MAYFSEISLMASLNILSSNLHIFLKEIPKKLGKKPIRKFFVAHQKLLRIFHGTSIYA